MAYREAMASFAQMETMDVWYAYMDEDELMRGVRGAVAEAAKGKKGKDTKVAKRAGRVAEKTREKAHTRDSLQALSKLSEVVDGKYRIVSQPPIVVPERDLAATYGLSAEEADRAIREQFRAYRATLQDDRRYLLERFEIADTARKVVGVGSVGTRAFIVLLQGRDARDPLFLQIKEATASVLEEHCWGVLAVTDPVSPGHRGYSVLAAVGLGIQFLFRTIGADCQTSAAPCAGRWRAASIHPTGPTTVRRQVTAPQTAASGHAQTGLESAATTLAPVHSRCGDR
jgi:hypothetical protein